MRGRVLIYGGNGALGKVVLKYFKDKSYVTADANIIVDPMACWIEHEAHVLKEVEDALKGDKLDAILCVAGGWAGGNAASKDFIKNADLMWKQSVWSSSISARLATQFLKPSSLLQLTGAAAATSGTAGMIGYSMAKAAVHHLVQSLANSKEAGLPEDTSTVAILPVTLDTPMNRKWMSKADFSKWTPLEFVAETLYNWTTEPTSRFPSGSLLKFTTTDGNTEITAV
ncbi:Dihydropteridine reductase [Aphelenchoides besseyi]|nr:Dihydropteridine reductase [Aphelenchoides besseyi]